MPIDGLLIKRTFKMILTTIPPHMEIIGLCCNLCACKIEVVMVSIAVKKTEIARIDKSGAAAFTDSWFLNKRLKIGFAKIDRPRALGIEIIAANLRQDCITLEALSSFSRLSASSLAVLIARSAAVSSGVSEEAIGVIKADGRCDIVKASVQ